MAPKNFIPSSHDPATMTQLHSSSLPTTTPLMGMRAGTA
jgi:hypothetical protein